MYSSSFVQSNIVILSGVIGGLDALDLVVVGREGNSSSSLDMSSNGVALTTLRFYGCGFGVDGSAV